MTAATIYSVRDKIGGIVGSLLPILAGLSLLYFIWGLVVFIGKSGEAEAREEGRRKMIWGVVALFVVVTMWGLVRFIGSSFSINSGGTGPLPQF